MLEQNQFLVMTVTNGHNGHTTPLITPAATKLRRLLEDSSELIVCPGVYDGLSARIALSIGFSAMYMV